MTGHEETGRAVEQLTDVNGLPQVLDLGPQGAVYEMNCVGMDKLGSPLRNEPKEVEVGGSVSRFCREGQTANRDATKRPVGSQEGFFGNVNRGVSGVKLGGILLIFLPDIERQALEKAGFPDFGKDLREHETGRLLSTAVQKER